MERRDLLLGNEAFNQGAMEFVAVWEKWVKVQNQLLNSKIYDVALLKTEERLWKKMVSKMRQLAEKRAAKQPAGGSTK